jgi:ABC-type uncharacterized transport system permease subunit
VVSDLAKPIRLLWRDVGEGIGRGLYYLLARAPVLFAACGLVFGVWPPLRVELVVWPISLVLAMAVMACLWFLAHSVAFWAEHNVGSLHLMLWPHTLFGGLFVPLDFFPEPLRLLADVLPFRAALYTPVALLAGRLTGPDLLFGLVHQVLWLVALLWLASAVEARGVRRVVAHGG